MVISISSELTKFTLRGKTSNMCKNYRINYKITLWHKLGSIGYPYMYLIQRALYKASKSNMKFFDPQTGLIAME